MFFTEIKLLYFSLKCKINQFNEKLCEILCQFSLNSFIVDSTI